MKPTIEHLYFHIPFCAKKCPYCCFYVEEGSRNKNRAFLDALLKEVESAAASYRIRPQTLYFGGGTPTALLIDQLEYLLLGLKERIDCSHLREWTMEANPANVRPEKAALLAQLGVTRVSLGVQSWNDRTLHTLGRIHSGQQARNTFEILRNAGIPELNIDLMYSVPGQSLSDWEADLSTTISLQPDHISAYCLTYEEDTEYFEKLSGGSFQQDEERDAQLFELTMDHLGAAGYHNYEISNYARPHRESRHNQAYWEGELFLGFGPSAFSTLPDCRTQNVSDTATYTQRILSGADPVSFREPLDEATRLKERIAFGLRMHQGLEAHLLAPWETAVHQFEEFRLLERVGSKVRLTRQGRLLADTVAEAFI